MMLTIQINCITVLVVIDCVKNTHARSYNGVGIAGH